MLELSQIKAMSREAGLKAAKENKKPYIWEEGDDLETLLKIPNIGDHRPEGYTLIEEHFVDKTGVGAEDEPALTIEAFLAQMKPGHAYAIIEEGEFQVYIGEFMVDKKK